jgi:hypothetical protein
VRECAAARSTTPKPVESFSASDVGQTFLSAGSGDFPVPGFRVKLSALVREVGKLRNRQAGKPALQFGQHALKLRPHARALPSRPAGRPYHFSKQP